ncbi:uncharacterized protein LOC105735673 [Apis florea]|uniref:uncharacterized protein LOC105735673 n=1 Tax=Apis florea TaxID=7463 RepID=UPI0012FE9800|nr:uncharacterized protein LOC105735673 [Apis florea]
MSGKRSRKGIFIKTCTCLYDEKTAARLDRENEETWKGFVALEKYKRSLKEEALKLQVEDEKVRDDSKK